MNQKQNIFHGIAKVNFMVESVFQMKIGIKNRVDGSAKMQ